MSKTTSERRTPLSLDELATVLGFIKAGPVVGLDPEAISNADTDRGLERLRNNGWMTRDGNGWKLDHSLAIAAAAIAAPSRVLILTINSRRDGQPDRTVAFYNAGLYVAELHRIEAGFIFNLSADSSGPQRRVARLIGSALDQTLSSHEQVDLPSDGVNQAMEAESQEGRQEAFRTLFENANVEASDRWASALRPGSRRAAIHAVGLLGPKQVIRKDLYCFGSPAVVIVGEERAGTDVVVADYSPETLDALVGLMWNEVGAHYAHFGKRPRDTSGVL